MHWFTSAQNGNLGQVKAVTSNEEPKLWAASILIVILLTASLACAEFRLTTVSISTIVRSESQKNTMSSSEADSEISYDSEGSGESFLDEIEAEHEVMHATPADYSPYSSDDEAAAYADDPLADAEWTANY